MSRINSLPRGVGDSFASRWWQRIYPLPNTLASLEEWQRYWHQDLAALDDWTLRIERHRCWQRLACEDRPHPWLMKRLEALRDELARRGYRR